MALSACTISVEGPWGGEGDSFWTDGAYCSIKSLTVRHGEVIDAIQVEYETGDKAFPAPQHGGTGGDSSSTISLDEGEYLTKIEGRYGEYNDVYVITKLTFTTNKGNTYGPFGTEIGDTFESSGKGKIVGFFGRAKTYLDAIGIFTVEA